MGKFELSEEDMEAAVTAMKSYGDRRERGCVMSSEQKTDGKAAVVLLFLTVPLMMLAGVVGKDLWSWFVMPVLHAPPITVWQAVGLQTAAMWFIGYRAQPKSITMDYVVMLVLTPLAWWGLGALVHMAIT